MLGPSSVVVVAAQEGPSSFVVALRVPSFAVALAVVVVRIVVAAS